MILLVPMHKWIARYPVFSISLVLFLYALYFSIRILHLPGLFMKRRYWSIAGFLLFFAAALCLLYRFPYPESEFTAPSQDFALSRHLRGKMTWMLILVTLGFSLSIELTIELFKQMLSRKELEMAKNRAELALYKAQIDPHFLFNTLNTLYGLVVERSDRAETAFVKFTNILQYLYRHATDTMIPIREEIDYIGCYLELQSLRLNGHTTVVWETDIDDGSVPLPPMILITFVENAFQYGSSPSRDCTIRIRAVLHQGELAFETQNTVMRRKKTGKVSVGIENCRLQLELLYPGRFSLEAGQTGEQFNVRLKIRLQ